MHATSKKSPLLGRPHLGRGPCRAVAVPDRRPVRVLLPHRRPDRQSGWWASLFTQNERQAPAIRIEGAEEQVDGEFVITGNLFEAGNVIISRWGTSSREPEAYEPDQVVDLGDGERLTVAENGDYRLSSPQSFGPPAAGLHHGHETARVHARELPLRAVRSRQPGGHGQGLLQHADGDDPGTIIPILIAAFAAYALAWMEFPGRALLIAAVVGAAGGAAAAGADPAFEAAQRHRHRQGLSRGLAGAYRLRPAAGDLSVAQLHGRPAA
jgi:hypothetical protein